MTDLSGKTALVTGGTRGIGRSIVKLLAELGCAVIYTGTKIEDNKSSDKRTFMQLDLSKKESIETFFYTLASIPKIDILVNNAGINIIDAIDEIKHENWEKILKVNLTGAMHLTREVSGKMRRSGGGRILNVSSIFGIVSREKRSAYSASKAGLIGLTRASALDLAPYNILVNALCHGFTMTDLTASTLTEKEIAQLSSEIPLGRFAREEEIARTAVFMCSDLNTYMTGQVVVADGGFIIQ